MLVTRVSVHLSVILILLLGASMVRAAAQIAPGVQQSAAQTATISGVVIQSDGTAVQGADVRLTGPAAQLVTKSDRRGSFSFLTVPFGRYKVEAISPRLGTASQYNVVINGDVNVTIQYTEQSPTLKEIAHVSTRSVGARINVTPASIASVNPSEYAFQGNTSWKGLLAPIPGVAVSGDLSGGLNGSNVIPGSPFAGTVLSINGALPYETSVTLDGMPLANTSVANAGQAGSGVDLFSLPMAAFDTADVVRGPGANAPSIVDSIGGSFVLHPPGRVDSNSFQLSFSNDPYGGIVSNFKTALRDGRFSVSMVYGVFGSPGPVNSNAFGFNTTPLTVNGQALKGCSPAAPFSGRCYFQQPQGTSQYQNPSPNGTVQSAILYCCVAFSTSANQHNGALTLSYDVTPSINASVFYANSGAQGSAPLWGSQIDFTPSSTYAGSFSPGIYSFVNSATQFFRSDASSMLEGKITAHVGNSIVRIAGLQNNSFTHSAYVNIYPNGPYALYGTGYFTSAPTTPVDFNGSQVRLTFTPASFTYNNWSSNHDYLFNFATQVNARLSVGASYVTSSYNDPIEFYGNSGAILFSGGQSKNNTETTREMRLQASAQITDRLTLDGSWYFAKGVFHVQNPNDLSGNTWTDSVFPYSAPRLSAVWRPNPDLAIRMSAGGGFAIPQISNLIGANRTPSCSLGQCTATVTNLNLTPEESFGMGIGSDIRLRRNTVVSVDLYRTNLYGQIFQSVATGTYSGPACTTPPCTLYTTQYSNLSQSRFEGVNADVHNEVPRGLYWRAALGLTRGYVVSVPPGFYNQGKSTCNFSTGTGCMNTYIVPGVNFDGKFQSTVPYANGAAQIGYRWGPGKYVDLSPTYYGNGNAYFEPAFVEFDAHAGYSFTKNLALSLTFRNITGIYGNSYDFPVPTVGAPTVVGLPFALFGLPYGPRALILTASFKG